MTRGVWRRKKVFPLSKTNVNPMNFRGRLFLLGALYIILSVGWLLNRWEFLYGVTYGLSFISMWLLYAYPGAPGFITILAALLSPLLSFAMSNGWLDATTGAIIVALLVGAAILNETGILTISVGKRSSLRSAWMVLALGYFAWLMLAVSYFVARIQHGWPLNIETILNHGGLAVWSLSELLDAVEGANPRVVSRVQTWRQLALLGWGATALGAILLVTVAGWGLALIPT